MTDRPRLDQLTDDQLDQLYADLDRCDEVQGEMNENAINLTRALARAEAARDTWAAEAATQTLRAEQAEAEIAVSREVAHSNRRHVQTIVPELEQAEAAIARVHAELDRIANLRTITHDDDSHADTFSTGVRWTIRIIRENALGEQADRTPPVHLGNRVNAEDCPGCSGTNPPYPFICPAQPGDPGGPYPTA